MADVAQHRLVTARTVPEWHGCGTKTAGWRGLRVLSGDSVGGCRELDLNPDSIAVATGDAAL